MWAWIAWLTVTVASFAILETVGVLTRDRFPTLSKVWKRWEDGGHERKGVVRWTLMRWFTLLGLLGLGTYLVLHWVAEII